jgi:hypothetical protein
MAESWRSLPTPTRNAVIYIFLFLHQHSIRICDPVLYKLDAIVLQQWHLPLWCAADSFLQYTCQMTATMNCLLSLSWKSGLTFFFIMACVIFNFCQFLIQVYRQASPVSLAFTSVFLLLADSKRKILQYFPHTLRHQLKAMLLSWHYVQTGKVRHDMIILQWKLRAYFDVEVSCYCKYLMH